MKEAVYTTKEAAKILKLKLSTLRTYCRTGRIACFRCGSNYRISALVIASIIDGTTEIKG